MNNSAETAKTPSVSKAPGTARTGTAPQRRPHTNTTRTGSSHGRRDTRPPRRTQNNPQRRDTPSDANRKKKDIIPPLAPGDIRIIPIGGLGGVGWYNMTAVEMNDEIVVVDAGIGFSGENTPGIDYLIPNTSYLSENKHKIKALVITHGHLDHIGAIPYIINAIGNPPIYSREFGALLVKAKASEFPDVKLDIRIVEKDDGAITLTKDIKVRFFGLTHSIPDSTGIALETPHGDIVSTGDVRVDNIDGVPLEKEFEQYKFFKNRKVLLMTMDSTGIPYPGWSASETEVVNTVDGIMKNVPGRLIVATFASQVERIIEFINSAKKYGKYVVIEGRSMRTNVGIVRQLDLTDLDHVIPVEDIDKYPPHKIVMLATGAQGEEFAALMRMSNKTHKQIRLTSTDTIVLSSSVIPGNEAAVDNLKDNLYRSDAKIITYMDNVVHASGHGKRDELAWIHTQIDYQFFMPIHGNYHRLKMHAELAVSLGAKPENMIVPESDGTIIDLVEQGTKFIIRKEKIDATPMTVEGMRVGEMQEVVLRDRKVLGTEGIVVTIVILDNKTKKIRKSPDIISRGFVYLRENQELINDTRMLIKRIVQKTGGANDTMDFDYLKKRISDDVGRYLAQKTAKRPIVIPVVLSF